MFFSALQSGAFEAAESLINGALKYDPATLRKMGELEGKVLLIESTMPPLKLAMETNAQGIMLHSNWQDIADTTVSGSLISIAGLAINSASQASFSGSGVNVSGDLDLLLKINSLMAELNVDWEAILASVIGDIPAHLMADKLRKSAAMAKDVGQRATSAAAEVAKEELRVTPTSPEFKGFSQQVRELSSGVERAAARLNKSRQILSKILAEQNSQDQSKGSNS
ncbi:SCP-2 sterol transfer family protein [Gammaproteobacteria bacterium MOLA455]|nr:SCP-2 sterol transfer family protein [Gammaproteobacteria bacterium MOLA455]